LAITSSDILAASSNFFARISRPIFGPTKYGMWASRGYFASNSASVFNPTSASGLLSTLNTALTSSSIAFIPATSSAVQEPATTFGMTTSRYIGWPM